MGLGVAAKARMTSPAFLDWSVGIVKGIAFLADLALAARACDKLSVAGPADCHENRTVASSLKDALSIGWQNALVPFWREENIPTTATAEGDNITTR